GEWPIHPRQCEHTVPQDGDERELRDLRGDRAVGDSPQERDSRGQHAEQSGRSLLAVPQQSPQVRMVGKAEIAIVSDPPYGMKWDGSTKTRGWELQPNRSRVGS